MRCSRVSYSVGSLLITAVLLLSCGVHKPKPLQIGHDKCSYCSMIVSDPKFGAEIISTTGKIYPFDAVECLAAYVLTEKLPKEKIHSLWVTSFLYPQKFVPAESAFYVRSSQIRSPMGLSLAAVEREEEALRMVEQYGGKILRWPDVIDLVEEEWNLVKEYEKQ